MPRALGGPRGGGGFLWPRCQCNNSSRSVAGFLKGLLPEADPSQGPHSGDKSHASRSDFTRYACRGTTLIRNNLPLGPYSRTMPLALWKPYGGGGCFLRARYPCTSCLSRVTLLSHLTARRSLWVFTLSLVHTPKKMQGYLNDEKTHPPRTQPWAYA